MSLTNTSIGLLDLPFELRTQILSLLLPDLPTIECDVDYSHTGNSCPRKLCPQTWTPGVIASDCQFRSDGSECETAILRVCKQLHEEGTDYLYRRKTYKIHVFDYGIDFLSGGGELLALPLIPFHEMKELVIEVVGCGMTRTGTRLRDELAWICGLLRHHNVQLKKLRIDLGDWYWWMNSWDETLSEECAPPLPPHLDVLENDDCNAEAAAWEEGFESTFAYIISALKLLPVVDECTIPIPDIPTTRWPIRGPEDDPWDEGSDDDSSYEGITTWRKAPQHIHDLAKWYEEGIDGTYAFEEDLRLQRDRAGFAARLKHPRGGPDAPPDWDCGCEDCVEYFKEERRRDEERRREAEEFARNPEEGTRRELDRYLRCLRTGSWDLPAGEADVP
ncbi:MAG: hypothetical protein LQ346_005353 [Caloplaca aetnensis]|nr:MAG: hypothetical protein LQ346_005353 [Caloplaca aetnensis]